MTFILGKYIFYNIENKKVIQYFWINIIYLWFLNY